MARERKVGGIKTEVLSEGPKSLIACQHNWGVNKPHFFYFQATVSKWYHAIMACRKVRDAGLGRGNWSCWRLCFMEFNESRPTGRAEGTWKILYSTGKWKGIKGSGKHVHFGGGRPIKPGTKDTLGTQEPLNCRNRHQKITSEGRGQKWACLFFIFL